MVFLEKQLNYMRKINRKTLAIEIKTVLDDVINELFSYKTYTIPKVGNINYCKMGEEEDKKVSNFEIIKNEKKDSNQKEDIGDKNITANIINNLLQFKKNRLDKKSLYNGLSNILNKYIKRLLDIYNSIDIYSTVLPHIPNLPTKCINPKGIKDIKSRIIKNITNLKNIKEPAYISNKKQILHDLNLLEYNTKLCNTNTKYKRPRMLLPHEITNNTDSTPV
jgi:hypothetical protein